MTTPYLKSMKIQNIGGLKKFEVNFHPVTILVAENAKGKTSVIGGVSNVFEGGSAPDMLLRGAAKGSIEIAFANGYTATKTITPTGYKLDVSDPNGGIVPRAASKIGEWVPKDGFDIRELVRMVQHDAKALEKFLLDHLPLTFQPSEVNPLLMGTSSPVSKALALPELNALRQAKYDQRTEINRDIRNLKGTIASLEGSLPDAAETDWPAERDRLAASLAGVDVEILQATSEIDTEAARLIAENLASTERQITALRAEHAAYEKKVAEKAASTLAAETAEMESRKRSLSEELGVARGRAEAQTKAAGVRESIETEKARLNGHVTKETTLGMVIEAFDKLKGAKLKELPVEGLDVRQDGKATIITVNDVPLHKLSGQEQIFMVVKFVVAAQRAAGAEMNLIVCEGAELDEKHLIELGEACTDAGVQLIVSMRRPGAELQALSLEEFRNLPAVSATGGV